MILTGIAVVAPALSDSQADVVLGIDCAFEVIRDRIFYKRTK